ncbi:YdcF family protein [Paenibacillus cisolokensis]|mgnify:CR=1 FL=1|jgi:uncharacterized SAM-binding protein YcdF (DUF218 family)|uniref:YdcF family protein n=1 Tax=Paenibacillus cisolokensis TaxID=1658519 RepID=UPI003D2BB9A3
MKRRGKKRRPLYVTLRLSAWAVAIAAFWIGYQFWAIHEYKPPKPMPTADVGIVLGAALWDGEPSPALRERLDHAVDLYKSGYISRIIVSGGYDYEGAALTEAEGMRNYLVKQQIPGEHIRLENDATNTYENLLYSKKIMDKQGWKSALIITHTFHAKRSGDIADYLGYTNTTVAAVKSRVLSAARYESREVLALTKWHVDKLLMSWGLGSPVPAFQNF